MIRFRCVHRLSRCFQTPLFSASIILGFIFPCRSLPAQDRFDFKRDAVELKSPVPIRALLVGCTNYPALGSSLSLRGPINDVALMKHMLEDRFGVPNAKIAILTEKEKETYLPTKANIEREFRRLAESAIPGEQIVILLAGHGSRQPDQPPYDEEDGLDEIFLPRDIGAWDERVKTVKNAIVDDELKEWLTRIDQKGASIWLIVDSCHAGTMIRGVSEGTPRSVAADRLVPARLIEEAKRSAKERANRIDLSTDRGFDLADSPGSAVLYACRDDETTFELPARLNSAEHQPTIHGLFTYAICRVLAEAKEPLSYRVLVQRVHALYQVWRRPTQTPVVEGRGQYRRVLGFEEIQRSTIALEKTNESWSIDAGSLMGLKIGSILDVFPLGEGHNDDKVVGGVRVLSDGLTPFHALVLN